MKFEAFRPWPSLVCRRRSIPGGLLGAIGLILAVEGVLGWWNPRPRTFGVAEYQFAVAAFPDASKYEVLCLGDSMVKEGLLPRVIAARTGRPAYNFAISGGRPPVTYFMLRRLIDAGARPSALVVDFTPAVASADFRDNLAGLAELVSPGDAFDLTWTARDPWIAVTMALDWVVTTLRGRFERYGPGAAEKLAPLLRNLAENAGALVLPANPRSSTTAEFWNERSNLRSPWACDPVNAVYVERTLALAGAHNIPVFWLITPMHPRVQAGRERLGLDDGYTRFVRSIAARHPNVCVIDGRRSAYDPDRFIDATHLDRRGAFVLSVEVAAIVGRHDPEWNGSRWLELPAYRTRRVDLPGEDLDESRLALKARESPRIR